MQNSRLAEIREKLRNPAMSKTHQGNWSNNVVTELEKVHKRFKLNGDPTIGKVPNPQEIPQ